MSSESLTRSEIDTLISAVLRTYADSTERKQLLSKLERLTPRAKRAEVKPFDLSKTDPPYIPPEEYN